MQKLIFIVLLLLTSKFSAQISARLFQYPDVSKSHITFSYGGDIWIVEKEGGIAHKLTSADGMEILPKFSPDGAHIAFSGNYEGNVDVYVIPTFGGIPKRITSHGMTDRVVDWYPDGNNILFASSRESGKQRFNQFFKVSLEGGLANKLPLPYAEFGSLSPDGKMLTYTPITRNYRTWKRYRGGMAPDVWTFNLENYSSENITKNSANDELPMWGSNQYSNKIYFLSDQDENRRYNIWCYDTNTKQKKQLTYFNDYDIHFPSIGHDDIVFEAGGNLYLLNLQTEEYKEIKVEVVIDESSVMPRSVNAAKLIQNVSLSHDGNRAIFEARGELFSVPAENGPVLNITQSSGYAERYPSWSPNGKFVAYWSDRSGEYELTIRDLTNSNSEKKLTTFGPGYRYQIFWSPNSEMIAFIDKAMELFIYDIKKNKTIKVDKQLFYYEGGLRNFSVNWSSDSKYLTYAKEKGSRSSAIAIFDIKENKLNVVTSDFYNDTLPVFDPTGKYLFFFTNRNFSPIYSDFENTWVYSNSTQIAVVPLTNEISSPLAPKNDSTSVKKDEEKKNENDTDKKDEKKKNAELKATKIVFEGFEERMQVIPIKAGNYRNLNVLENKIIFHKFPNNGSNDDSKPIVYFDLDKLEEKTIVNDADAFQLSADGKKILVLQKGSYYVVKPESDQKLEKKMPMDQLSMTLVPKEEWYQIFNDVWRFERDFFYDPNMHGVNWDSLKVHYSKLLEHASTRWDVNFIIGELIAELSASHAYRGGGDVEEAQQKPVGYLGIDWGVKNGYYFVKRIIKGASWDSEIRSALDKSGLNVKEGDYILAVNGVPINSNNDPYFAFQGIADKTVELTVNNKPSGDGAWKIITKTLNDETRLRNLEWIESNRKRVEKATNGRVGYIYVPSTGLDGQYELVRMFYAQFEKEGLIIDERFNNGGQIPDRFIELLNRKPVAFWAVRDGKNWQWPPMANFGPKVMLTNGWSGSGGDAFPDYFRKAELGPLIGSRTWGGLIGITGAPYLIDGGNITVPTFRMFDPDGKWFKEGHGVDPDIEVEENPTQLANGVDNQLERAIEEILKELDSGKFTLPNVPNYEKR